MADTPSPEMLGSGMARNAARDIKYRNQYNKVVIAATMSEETPPKYEDWLAQQVKTDEDTNKKGVMQRLRSFIAK